MVVGAGEVDDRGRWGSAGGVVDAPAFRARAFKALARAILVDESITDLANQRTEVKTTPSQAQGIRYTRKHRIPIPPLTQIHRSTMHAGKLILKRIIKMLSNKGNTLSDRQTVQAIQVYSNKFKQKQPRVSTKVGGEAVSIELIGNELGSVEDHSEASQGLAYLPVSRGKLIQRLGLCQFGFLRPV